MDFLASQSFGRATGQTKGRKLKNVAVGLLASVFVALLWALIDGVKGFPFLPFIALGLDAVYVVVRLVSVRAISLPKLPILYLPFTTIWAVAIGTPAAVYQHTAVWGWGAYLSFAAVTAIALFSYRLVRASTQYQLADERVSEDTASDFREAFKDRSKFFSPKKGYLLDPPNRDQLPRIDLARFDGQVNELLNHSYFPPFYLTILACVFFGLLGFCLHYEEHTDNTPLIVYSITRWLWPALAAIVCLRLALSTASRWNREQLGLVAWSMQLFANSPRSVDTDRQSSWTQIGPYGHTLDRHLYLLFSYGLIYALSVQLLVLAPVFIPDSMWTVSKRLSAGRHQRDHQLPARRRAGVATRCAVHCLLCCGVTLPAATGLLWIGVRVLRCTYSMRPSLVHV